MQLLCQTDTYEWLQRTGSDMTQANYKPKRIRRDIKELFVVERLLSVGATLYKQGRTGKEKLE